MLCAQLISEMPRLKVLGDKELVRAQATVSTWHEILVAASALNIFSVVAGGGDIPDEPDPKKRALAFWPIISGCVDDLDESPSDNTKRFLLHVAWHEGDKLRTRLQYGDGPGRSFFQFEAYRAKEALQYARQKDLLITWLQYQERPRRS